MPDGTPPAFRCPVPLRFCKLADPLLPALVKRKWTCHPPQMPSAFIIGGTGQIGRAVAGSLSGAGWAVRVASRTRPSDLGTCDHVRLDRNQPGALAASLGGGADLLLDCVSMDAGDADHLLSVQDRVGTLVVVSSASVYRDEAGRTLDEAAECGFPRFPVPIPEDHPTVAPGPETYSTRKVAMERRLMEGARVPATVLRPCAIHGPHSRHAREWWFVKRLLDGRRRIPLAYGGRSRFQTTSTAAIAAAVRAAAAGEVSGVVNVADADAPTVAEIGRTVMAVMGRDAELVGLPDEAYPPTHGSTPWSIVAPMVCASSLPLAGTYAETVPPTIHWLVEATHGRDWREVLPQLAAYPRDHFDYAEDDKALA